MKKALFFRRVAPFLKYLGLRFETRKSVDALSVECALLSSHHLLYKWSLSDSEIMRSI